MKEDISNEKITLTHAGNDGVFPGHIFLFLSFFISLFCLALLFFLYLAIRREVQLILGDGTDDETDLKSILPV